MSGRLREKLKWLDPFTYVDLYVMPVVNPAKDGRIELVVDMVFAFIFAFILYNYVLATLLGTSTPLVIVYSESMEPVLHRGDVVVLNGSKEIIVDEVGVDFPLRGRPVLGFATPIMGEYIGRKRVAGIAIGDKNHLFDSSGPIVVYRSTLSGLDIIHRAVLRLKAPDGDFLITYGDNGLTNSRFDEMCPPNPQCTADLSMCDCITEYPVAVQELKGNYLFHIPLVGYVKLLVFDDLPKLISYLASLGQTLN